MPGAFSVPPSLLLLVGVVYRLHFEAQLAGVVKMNSVVC